MEKIAAVIFFFRGEFDDYYGRLKVGAARDFIDISD